MQLATPRRQADLERPDSLAAGDAIAAAVQELFESDAFLPPILPRVAAQLLAMAGDEMISAHRVVEVLEQDPVLTGHVLRLVRSPYYSGATSVLTLRHAVVRLGFVRLRQAVVEAAFSVRVFRAPRYQNLMTEVANHARATAHIARLAARHTGTDPEHAFLCGLVHDVGIAGLIILLSEQAGKGAPSPEHAWPVVERLNAEAGRRMVRAWKLDPLAPLLEAVHAEGDVVDPTAAVVVVADRLASDFGFGITPPGATKAPPEEIPTAQAQRLERARQLLFFGDDVLDAIRAEAVNAVASLR